MKFTSPRIKPVAEVYALLVLMLARISNFAVAVQIAVVDDVTRRCRISIKAIASALREIFGAVEFGHGQG